MPRTDGPDLSGASAAVEKLMDDDCIITRSYDADLDQMVLNEESLDLIGPEGTTIVVYEGQCKFKHESAGTLSSTNAKEGTVQRYKVSIPLAVSPMRRGDKFTLTGSRRLPDAVGLELRIVAIEDKTMAVQRSASAERWDADQPAAIEIED